MGNRVKHCTQGSRLNQRQIWLAVHLPLILSHRERHPFDRDDVIETSVSREQLFVTTTEFIFVCRKICRQHLPLVCQTHRPQTGTRHVNATAISRPHRADAVKSAAHLPISVTGSNACVDGRQPSDSRANGANNVGANTGLAVKG